MKRLFLLSVVLVPFGYAEQAVASGVSGDECYQCDQWQYEAKAEQLAFDVVPSGKVYVLDRFNNVLKKYLVTSEPQPNADPQAQSKNKALDQMLVAEGITEKDIIDHIVIERRSFLIDLWDIPPSSEEIELFNNFDYLAEKILGIGDPGNSSGVNATVDVDIPLGAIPDVGSAHDVIGNFALGLQVGSWVIANHTNAIFWREVAKQVSSLFAIRYIAQYKYNVRVHFPDGSLGIWDVNEVTQFFEPLFDTFFDSELNSIPNTLNDISGRTFRFDGGAGENPNIGKMAGRIELIGGSITGDTSGGCSVTTFTCGPDSCRVTCRMD